MASLQSYTSCRAVAARTGQNLVKNDLASANLLTIVQRRIVVADRFQASTRPRKWEATSPEMK